MKMCLIGSTRFMESYVEANRELTLRGHIVYTVATISTASALKDTAHSPITEKEKEILDLVHLRKISESDSVVLITDETGYYGPSTRREMLWASILEKPLLVYVPTKPVASIFQYHQGLFSGRNMLDIPTPTELSEGWKEASSKRETDSVISPGGSA